MKASEIKKHLEINKQRQEIIDALLIARDHSDEIQTIKALSKDARAEIIEKFNFSSLQAQAVVDIKKPLFHAIIRLRWSASRSAQRIRD